MDDGGECAEGGGADLHQVQLLQLQQFHQLLEESRVDERRCVAHQRVGVDEDGQRLEARLDEQNAVLIVPEAGRETCAGEQMIFLVVVQVLVEILPQLDGDALRVVLGDVLMVDDLQGAAFRVVLVVEVVDGRRHLLVGTAAVGEAESALLAAVRFRDVLQPTQQSVLLVAAQARDEIAALREHVQQVEDAEDDFQICREQQLREVLNGVVKVSREAVLDEECREVEDQQEKLAALKIPTKI